jgi:uncharacterized protein (DUF58 family)
MFNYSRVVSTVIMEVTRRFWQYAGVGGTLVALAVVFAQPVLLYGGAGIGAFLLFRQLRFLRALSTTDTALTVEQSVPSKQVQKGDESNVTLSVHLTQPSSLTLQITSEPPLIADAPASESRSCALALDEQDAETTYSVSWPVVGRATFNQATIMVKDPAGLFQETFERGPTPTVVVTPRLPRNIHVGEGGNQTVPSYDGHRSDQLGAGTDPAEIRQYVPGDTVSDIDWKATARMDYPHVREYEVETDQQSILFVDHRQRLRAGKEGETPFDYLRELALSFVTNAEEMTDATGLAVVDDNGLRTWESPATSAETYNAIRTTLQDQQTTKTRGSRLQTAARTEVQSAGAARQKAAALASDESAFSHTLKPFFAEAEGYVQRMDDDPLFGALRTQLQTAPGANQAIILTDDTERTSLKEAVKLAQQQASHVVVFLTPQCLFSGEALADLDDAYEEYVQFEEFRRELARLDRVDAYEIAPGDRIEAVLSARADKR